MRLAPTWRARFLVETFRSPCISTTMGSRASFSMTSVFTISCSGTPSARPGTSVPPCSTYSYSCDVYETPCCFRKSVAGVSATRMMLRVQLLQALARYMRIDLRRRDVGVPQEQLDHAQVGAVIDEVRGECMAQAVR